MSSKLNTYNQMLVFYLRYCVFKLYLLYLRRPTNHQTLNFIFRKRSYTLVLLCLSSFFVQAQVNKDASYYLTDEVSTSKNNVSINVLAIVNGDVPILYERKLGKRFRVSAGLGLLLPYYSFNLNSESIKDSYGDDIDPYKVDDRGFGRSYMLQFKYFGIVEANKDFYLGLYYRNRKFDAGEYGKITYLDYMLTQGYVYYFNEKFLLDIGIAQGFRNNDVSNKGEKMVSNEIGFAVTISASLGYTF